MDYQDYASNCPHPDKVCKANYDSLIHFCIAFDVDWINESYLECREKVLASMESISEEMNLADNPVEAHKLLVQRAGRLRTLK